MKIYVVFGETGNNDDNHSWMVRAFFDEEKAMDLAVKAEMRANQILDARTTSGDFYSYKHITDPAMQNEFDPAMGIIQETGTSYTVEPVELEE